MSGCARGLIWSEQGAVGEGGGGKRAPSGRAAGRGQGGCRGHR